MKHNLLIISAFLSAMTFSGLVQAQQTPHGGGFDRNAMSKVCQGKKSGQPVNTKMGDHTVKGTCELGFSANNPDALPRGERGQQQSTAQACHGKKVGQNVTVKINGKAVNGKCEIRFKGQRG